MDFITDETLSTLNLENLMKLSLKIIVLLFFQNVFCQQYHFDNSLEYKDSINDESRLYLYNSSDDSYYLYVFSIGENFVGNIYDKKNKIVHKHTVTNYNNSIKFNYQSTTKWNSKRDKNNFTHKTSEKQIDSSKTQVSVLIYRDNKQKIWGMLEITIENNDFFNNEELINSFTDGTFPNNQTQKIKGFPININFPNSYSKTNYTLIRKEKINTILQIFNIKMKYY